MTKGALSSVSSNRFHRAPNMASSVGSACNSLIAAPPSECATLDSLEGDRCPVHRCSSLCSILVLLYKCQHMLESNTTQARFHSHKFEPLPTSVCFKFSSRREAALPTCTPTWPHKAHRLSDVISDRTTCSGSSHSSLRLNVMCTVCNCQRQLDGQCDFPSVPLNSSVTNPLFLVYLLVLLFSHQWRKAVKLPHVVNPHYLAVSSIPIMLRLKASNWK